MGIAIKTQYRTLHRVSKRGKKKTLKLQKKTVKRKERSDPRNHDDSCHKNIKEKKRKVERREEQEEKGKKNPVSIYPIFFAYFVHAHADSDHHRFSPPLTPHSTIPVVLATYNHAPRGSKHVPAKSKCAGVCIASAPLSPPAPAPSAAE